MTTRAALPKESPTTSPSLSRQPTFTLKEQPYSLSLPSFVVTNSDPLTKKGTPSKAPSFFNKKSGGSKYRVPPLVTPVSPQDLTLSFLSDYNSLIIDVRPYTLYVRSRIVNSLNACVPTTLLKRKTFSLKNVIATMCSTHQQVILSKLEPSSEPLNILLYDDVSTDSSCSFHLHQTALKFQSAEYSRKLCIFILQGGISAVSDVASLMDCSPVCLSPSSESFPGSPLSVDSDSRAPLSGFSLPKICSLGSSVVKKSSSDYHNYASSFDKINLPPNLNENKLPPWLKPFAEQDGFKLVAQKFDRIESLENTRLSNLVAQKPIPNSASSSTEEDTCSPSAPCSKCDRIAYTLPTGGIEEGTKNRYASIWPYEHSRVTRLQTPCAAAPPNQDNYFNANYITVPAVSKNKYIATQAPLPTTFDDFWRAIWYNKVEVVVCLTNLVESGMKKSDKYWQDGLYGGVSVKLIDETEIEDTILRTLEISKKDDCKTIHQLEFKCWPDFGVPPSGDSILKLIKLKNGFVTQETAPIVVHCSAGCGRTGTFITIDMVMDALAEHLSRVAITPQSDGSVTSPFAQLRKEMTYKLKPGDPVDHNRLFHFFGDEDLINKTVHELRRLRISMVQNLNQFIMCYETIIKHCNESV